MTIRGILFDKDGTLLDFEALWLPILLELVGEIAQRFGVKEERLLAAAGVYEGVLDSKGVFAAGTGEMMGEAFFSELVDLGAIPGSEEEFTKELIADFNAKSREYRGRIVPIGDLKGTIQQLKARGFALGISTADNRESTVFSLRELGVLDYFDFLGTIDGKRQRPKPHGDILKAFCHQFSFAPQEVAVVGDTETDLLFAKRHGALAIGVLSGLGTEEDLREYADLLIGDVNELLGLALFKGSSSDTYES